MTITTDPIGRHTAPAEPPPAPLLNPTMLGLELTRMLRNPVGLFFTAILPAFFYVVFGAAQAYGDEPVGNGNVSMSIMIAMAAYGAVTATISVGGSSALERSQGWGRQLGLTPLRDRTYVAVKVALAVLVAGVPITLIYTIGALSGAEGPAPAWLLSALVLVVGSMVFSLYGLAFGLAFRSEAAVSGAGGSVVILGFLGNVFFPLSGALLAVARWTPLYGYASLARYPLTEGWLLAADGGLVHEPLWIPVVNVAAWLLILALTTTWLVRRGRGRQ